MNRLVRGIDRLSAAVGLAGAGLVVPLALIMSWEVLARFLLDLPTFWAYELSYMLTGSHFALGIALVTLRREHIRIDFVYARLPVRVRAGIDFLVIAVCVLPVMAWTAGGLVLYAGEAYLTGELSGESGWNPVIWPVRAVVAAGFLLFSLQLFAEAVKLGAVAAGRPPPGAEG